MIPNQVEKRYISAIVRCDSNVNTLVAETRDTWRLFWDNPIVQARILQPEALACGMSPAAVFQSHGILIGTLSVLKPDNMAWFTGVPIQLPFNEDGTFDFDLLESRWNDYQDSLPPAEE